MAYVMAFGIPCLVAGFGFVMGVIRDGSPFRRSWWTK